MSAGIKQIKEHDLKCWPQPFDAVLRGAKPYELRRDDRGFAIGDVLILREFDPSPTGGYTGNVVRKRITWITNVRDWIPSVEAVPRWVVLGLEGA